MDALPIIPDSGDSHEYIFTGGSTVVGGGGYSAFVWLNVVSFSHTPLLFFGTPTLRNTFGNPIAAIFVPSAIILSATHSSTPVQEIRIFHSSSNLSYSSSPSDSLRLFEGKLQHGTKDSGYMPALSWWAILDATKPIAPL